MSASGLAMKFTLGSLLIVFWLCSCSTIDQLKPSITASRVTIMSPSPATTLDPKVALLESIHLVLGTDDRDLPRLTEISYSVPEAGDVTITWAINGNLSEHSTRVAAQIDATRILEVLENNHTRFIYVVLIGTFSTQDLYGNTIEVQAMRLGFNKSKLDQINWEDFQPSDVFDLADVVVVADEWK